MRPAPSLTSVAPRPNRPFKYLTCSNCEVDSWYLDDRKPPMACGYCQELFPLPDGVHDDTKLIARIARVILYLLAGIGVAILILNAVRG